MNIKSNGGSRFCTVLAVCVLFVIFKSPGQNLLVNGGFDTGNLTGWRVFVTANGNLGSAFGLPNVVPFDMAGTGQPSNAAQFQAGEAVFNSATGHTYQGGGIFQNFNSSAGLYQLSLQIAATNADNQVNASAGLFALQLDGATITNVNFGFINPGQTFRGTLEATLPLAMGSHEISLEITRPYLNGNDQGFGNTPLEYLDNIQVVPVPEPSTLLLGLLGLFSLRVTRALRTSK